VATGCQSDALRSVVADKTIDQSLTDARGPSDWVWLLCTCTKQRRRRVFARRLTPSATRRRNAPTLARWRHRMTSLPPRRARASCRRRHMAPRTRARRAAWGKQVSKNVPIRTRDIRRGERNNKSATCSRLQVTTILYALSITARLNDRVCYIIIIHVPDGTYAYVLKNNVRIRFSCMPFAIHELLKIYRYNAARVCQPAHTRVVYTTAETKYRDKPNF